MRGAPRRGLAFEIRRDARAPALHRPRPGIAAITWELEAEHGDGGLVPCMASVALARRLRKGHVVQSGARPAVGVMDLSDYPAELEGLRIRWRDDAVSMSRRIYRQD